MDSVPGETIKLPPSMTVSLVTWRSLHDALWQALSKLTLRSHLGSRLRRDNSEALSPKLHNFIFQPYRNSVGLPQMKFMLALADDFQMMNTTASWR
jgi:hypothetical protein